MATAVSNALQICEAMGEIIDRRLEGISYDKTLVCTIVDDSLKSEGKYYVTQDDNVRHLATSSITTYRKNENVYVTIPEGNWNNQAIIVGKKLGKTSDAYVYRKPLDYFVDMTGNLISGGSPVGQLTANGVLYNENKKQFETPINGTEMKLWERVASSSNADNKVLYNVGLSETGYTRLGISAEFQSWLEPFYVEGNQKHTRFGEYGLRLELVVSTDDLLGKDQSATETTYNLYLNTNDMNGNCYDYKGWEHQEKYFNISAFTYINRMTLWFYQKGDFYAADGTTKIPSTDDLVGNPTAENLFVKEPVISLGYDSQELGEEKAILYTFDPKTYNGALSEEENYKTIGLRWIHKFDNEPMVVTNKTKNLKYEIYWYRYVLGVDAPDPYAGVNWERVNANTTNSFSYVLSPDVKDTDTERVKVIIKYNIDTICRSDIITFTNERPVANIANIDNLNALNLVCEDGSYGNYRVYKQGGGILDNAMSTIEKTLSPYFGLLYDINTKKRKEQVNFEPLMDAEYIEWSVPARNTMLQFTRGGLAALGYETRFYPETAESEKTADRIIAYRYLSSGLSQEAFKAATSITYRISTIFSPSLVNNTIQCKIIKDRVDYSTAKEFTFGVAGTSGTDATLILDFDDNITALSVADNKGANNAVGVTARLYDYENKSVDLSGQPITWSILNNKDDSNLHKTSGSIKFYLTTVSSIDAKTKIYIDETTASAIGYDYAILQAKLTWNKRELISYLPIPLRRDSSYLCITGPTEVIYDSSGSISNYYKNPYVLYNKYGAPVENVVWTIYNGTLEKISKAGEVSRNNLVGIEGESTPKINENNVLIPSSFYTNGTCTAIAAVARAKTNDGSQGTSYWVQPIIIGQHNYPSKTVNAWDGNVQVGTDDDAGTILAPRLVAGKKNADNTFSGVLMGDWRSADTSRELSTQTGIYGFQKGAQSFAFKEDGTAFIGKSGKGRLTFDGNKSVITSNSYAAGLGGMSLDFDAGYIDMRKPSAFADKNNRITFNVTEKTTPFKIGTNFSVDWNGSFKSTAGTVGGWKIGENVLQSNNGKITLYPGEKIGEKTYPSYIKLGFTSGSDSSVREPNDKTGIILKEDGSLKAASGYFTIDTHGKMEATAGKIGGWTINKDSLSNSTQTVQLDSKGNFKINKISGTNDIYNFEIDSEGRIKSGYIDKGIYKFEVDPALGKLKLGPIYNTTDGKSTFVDHAFKVESNKVTLGGWNVNPNYLSNGKDINDSQIVLLNAVPTSSTYAILIGKDSNNLPIFSVDGSGNLRATSGLIGGWKITEKALQGVDVTSAESVTVNTENGQQITSKVTLEATTTSLGTDSIATSNLTVYKGATIYGTINGYVTNAGTASWAYYAANTTHVGDYTAAMIDQQLQAARDEIGSLKQRVTELEKKSSSGGKSK